MAQTLEVLCAVGIMQGDAAQAVGKGAGVPAHAWLIDGGPGKGTRLASQRLGQDDLAEAVIVEVFCNDQGAAGSAPTSPDNVRGCWHRQTAVYVGRGYGAGAALNDIRGRHAAELLFEPLMVV